MHQDETGTIWIGTAGSGIIRLNPASFDTVAITAEDGLGSNGIFHLMEDDRHYFWMTSQRGILRAHRDSLTAFSGEEGEQISVAAFGSSDGRRAFALNGIKNRAGHLLFATGSGVVAVDPAAVELNQVPPGITINNVALNGRHQAIEIGTGEPIQMKSNVLLEVSARAVTLRGTEALTYRHLLDGWDTTWTTTFVAGELNASYSDLKPGDYSFRVIAANNHGVWNESGASLTIAVRPTLFQRASLRYVLSAVAVLLLGAGTVGVQRNRERLRNKYRKTRLPDEVVDRHWQALVKMLDDDKVYRDSELSLKALAERLGIPPHHLSQTINLRFQKTYFQLINEYRIEEAKRLLLDGACKDRKILAIAYDVGFNTLNSFNRAFKRYVGRSPTEFRNQYRNA
jgi:AraC-like DNA-binding protein